MTARHRIIHNGRVGELTIERSGNESIVGTFRPDRWRVMVPNEGVERLTMTHDLLRRVTNDAYDSEHTS
jgi:hypothetical protein